MNRPEKYALAVQLLGEGISRSAVRVALDVTESGLRGIINDPDGSKQKARRERYKGTCARCGGKTEGSGGFRSQPVHCAPCAAIVNHEKQRWTQEAIIEAVQTWAAEHDGVPPTVTDWRCASKDGRFPAFANCYRHSGARNAPFANWADAIEAAGFPRPRCGLYRGRTDWTPEKIIEHLRALAVELGRSPRLIDLKGLSHVVILDRFGGFPEALDAAGLERNRTREIIWTRERIVEAIQRWTWEHGRKPTTKDWQQPSDEHPWPQTVIKRFGSWNAAIRAAGLVPYGEKVAA